MTLNKDLKMQLFALDLIEAMQSSWTNRRLMWIEMGDEEFVVSGDDF